MGSRAEFGETGEFKNWLNKHVIKKPKRYEIIVTSKNEVIANPTVSTENLDTGYQRFIDPGEAEKLVEWLKQSTENLDVFRVKYYIWDRNLSPGAKASSDKESQ